MSIDKRGGGDQTVGRNLDTESGHMHVELVTLKELFANKDLLGKFVRCYREVFDHTEASKFLAPGEKLQWQLENWNEEDVLAMLQKNLEEDTGNGEDTLLSLMINSRGDVVGFFYGSIVDGVDNLKDFPKSYSGLSSLDIDTEEIKRLIREKYPNALRFISMREMGIRGDIRGMHGGMRRIFELVTPLFIESLRREANYFVFWTSKNSNLFRISTGSGFDLIKDFNDEEQHVYMGADLLKLIKKMAVGPDAFKATMK